MQAHRGRIGQRSEFLRKQQGKCLHGALRLALLDSLADGRPDDFEFHDIDHMYSLDDFRSYAHYRRNDHAQVSRVVLLFAVRSEEHTSNSSHLGISYAVFCLKKK